MISLHVYLTPKAGRERELESAVRDRWLEAMSQQPGFLSAALLRPYPDEELAELQAAKPQSAYEAVCFWTSEAERLAWVARPIHDKVFAPVIEAAVSLTYTLQTVQRSWSL
jgi:heme-degrading monooxygenase HmoA